MLKIDILEKLTSSPHENEVSFQTIKNPDEYPFWISEYGVTHKSISYHELRMDSPVTCIEYIISGSGTIISNSNSFMVNAGDTYMLVEGSNLNYYSNPDDPFEKIWINVKGVLAKQIIEIYNLQDSALFRNTNTHEMIQAIHDICKTETKPHVIQDKVSCMFLGLIQYLYRNHRKIISKSDTIDLFRNYIDCHITENIKLAVAAEMVHMSVDHAIRIFKKKYGITPHQYIIDSKMKIAKSMLKATNNSIADIADSLDFSDPHNFSKQFHKYVGISPTVYRKTDIFEKQI